MRTLIPGVLKFQQDVFPRKQDLFSQLATGQKPHTLMITCADSRIVPEVITQTDPGEIFVVRNAGNIVPPYSDGPDGIAASIEYAVAVLKVPHILVLGHSDCGAMKGVMNPDAVKPLPAVANWLKFGEAARRAAQSSGGDNTQQLLAVTEENIRVQIANLKTYPSITKALQEGSVTIHGAVYHIGTGEVTVLEDTSGSFVSVRSYPGQSGQGDAPISS